MRQDASKRHPGDRKTPPKGSEIPPRPPQDAPGNPDIVDFLSFFVSPCGFRRNSLKRAHRRPKTPRERCQDPSRAPQDLPRPPGTPRRASQDPLPPSPRTSPSPSPLPFPTRPSKTAPGGYLDPPGSHRTPSALPRGLPRPPAPQDPSPPPC